MTTTKPRDALFSRMVCLVLLLMGGTFTDAFVVDPKDRNGSCPSSRRTINSNPVSTQGPGASQSAKHLFPFKNNNNSNNNNSPVDKGFNLLEIASQIVPQGAIVSTAKESWRFLWKRFMVELAPQDKNGSYQRPKYPFQGGGTIGSQQYPIETNRYHVYVGNPCPWCHRVRLVVNILRLQDDDAVGMTMLLDDPIKASRGGWVFATPPPQASSSSSSRSNKIHDLRQLYEHLSPGYQGRCTAPLLVDWKTRTIISNESKDIVRMLPLLKRSNGILDLTPATLQKQIDETNEWVYAQINNGVYQCGFATSQQSYDQASVQVFQGLDRAEAILTTHPYLCGESLTESDILLLPTMLRFDTVYAPLFGAGGSRHWKLATDFPHIHRWMKRCWHDIPGVADSIDLDDASKSYYKQLFPLNPGGIVPSVTITPRRLGLASE